MGGWNRDAGARSAGSACVCAEDRTDGRREAGMEREASASAVTHHALDFTKIDISFAYRVFVAIALILYPLLYGAEKIEKSLLVCFGIYNR